MKFSSNADGGYGILTVLPTLALAQQLPRPIMNFLKFLPFAILAIAGTFLPLYERMGDYDQLVFALTYIFLPPIVFCVGIFALTQKMWTKPLMLVLVVLASIVVYGFFFAISFNGYFFIFVPLAGLLGALIMQPLIFMGCQMPTYIRPKVVIAGLVSGLAGAGLFWLAITKIDRDEVGWTLGLDVIIFIWQLVVGGMILNDIEREKNRVEHSGKDMAAELLDGALTYFPGQ